MSVQASRRSTGVDVGQPGRQRLSSTATWARRKSRPSSGSASSRAAASFICSYSIRRRTSSARGSSASLPSAVLLRRQQHARLDLDQHRRHQQVVAGELEVGAPDLLDVGQVLPGHARHRDVEDVEVLLAGSGRAAGRAALRRPRGRPRAHRAGCRGRSAARTAARRRAGRRRCRRRRRPRRRRALPARPRRPRIRSWRDAQRCRVW